MADALVVVAEQLADEPGTLRIARLRDVNPRAGVVLVTRVDPENVTWIPHAHPDEVVALSRLDGTLSKAVRCAAGGMRAKLIDAARASSLSAWLVRALTAALEADPPFASVEAWCDAIACVPGTLRYHFDEEALVACDIRPKDFVALLLFALDHAPSARTWSALGYAVGVDWRRLKRTARRFLPGSINRPAGLDRTILFETIAGWLMGRAAPMLNQDSTQATFPNELLSLSIDVPRRGFVDSGLAAD